MTPSGYGVMLIARMSSDLLLFHVEINIWVAAANKKRWPVAGPPYKPNPNFNYANSKRSRFITLVQAATKSCTNFSLLSALP